MGKATILLTCRWNRGLMIETHPDRNATVDPLQAINFDEFSSLIDELKVGKVLNKKIV